VNDQQGEASGLRLQHFFMTRFSCRIPSGVPGANAWIAPDVLAPRRLEARFRLLRITALPTILGQTNKNFAWVIFVDPTLAEEYRHRLAELVCKHPQVHILDFPETGIGSLEQMRPFISTRHQLRGDDDPGRR
jgi:hypothetical protein